MKFPLTIVLLRGRRAWFLIRTFETRLDLRGADTSHLADVLDQYADLMARAERLLFAKLKAGRSFSGDLHVCLYKPLGITSTHLNMIHRQLQGKLSSVKEIAKERIGTIDRKIKFKLDDIVRKEKAIDKLRIDLARKVDAVKDLGKSVEVWRKRLCTQSGLGTSENVWPLKNRLTEYHAAVAAVATARTNLRSLKAAVHQHRRRLARLHHVREPAVKQVADPSLCFGSNKLFRSQLDLAGNGYGDHAEWHNECRPSALHQ